METYPGSLLHEEAAEQLRTLERELREDRRRLLETRCACAAEMRHGTDLAFSSSPAEEGDDWTVDAPPADLTHRLVELATPATAEAARTALASGADVWVADLEDMLVPTPERLHAGQLAIRSVAETRTGDPAPGVPTLMVRPRGLHLDEAHAEVDGEPASAALVDTFTFLACCGRLLLDNGTGPYLYLPKLETAQEAAWWDRMLTRAEELLGLPAGCTRVSVLVETVRSVYELDDIVRVLRHRVTGLTAGRWDYIFSFLRTYGADREQVLPDRDAFTMNSRFLRAYTSLVLQVARHRGVQALGGPIALAADAPFNQSVAMTHARVTRDKAREAAEGFDGAWVLHPGLVTVARAPFEEHRRMLDRGEEPPRRGGSPHRPEDLRDASGAHGSVTLTGVRTGIRSSLAYLTGWLAGEGTCTIDGHIEDIGTVELARMQLWQWLHHGVRLAEGPVMTELLLERMLEDEIALQRRRGAREDLLDRAVELLRDAVLAQEPPAFLSQQAYPVLLAQDEVPVG